ncbi:phosphotransferase [bacterium]|nr:phosphotransferase [bacterium]
MNHVLNKLFPQQPFTLTPVSSGASSKKFFRITGSLADKWKQPSLLLQSMADKPESLKDYIEIQRVFESQSIPSPKIFYKNTEFNFLLVEDLGDHTLENRICDNYLQNRNLYFQAIDLLIRLQIIPGFVSSVAAHRVFDYEKFTFEYQFHIQEQLLKNHFQYTLNEQEEKILDDFHRLLATEISLQPRVFTHRDFQSSNLLLSFDRLYLVDFQDARWGPAQYDLVSLIEDVYVPLDPDFKRELIRYYFNRTVKLDLFNPDSFDRIYDWTLIQRKLHDAGAFVYAYKHFGNKKYLPYISNVVHHVLQSMKRYEVFGETYELLNRIVAYGNRS